MKDFTIGDATNYPLPENYDREFDETSFSNPVYDDATTYNTSESSNLTTDADFTPQERALPVKSIYDIYNEISDLYSRDKNSKLENIKMSYLRNPKFTEGTKWRFTVTNRLELVDLVYTNKEINDLASHANLTNFDNAGITVPYLNENYSYRQKDSLFMLGKDRGGKLIWVRIADNDGKLLSRSTIEGTKVEKWLQINYQN